MVELLAAVAAAVVVGGVVAVWLQRQQAMAGERLATHLREEASAQREAAVQQAIETVTAVAGERLQAHGLAHSTELDGKKALIDAQLDGMRTELAKVHQLVSDLERDRAQHYGTLAEQIAAAGQRTSELAETTRALREALSSTKARGQWGERMAEDVLRLAGFIEGVNYRKQTAVATGGIPDFAFLLPEDREVRMDVKFPLDNYLRWLECDAEAEADTHCKAFLRDVRARVKELAGRDYIDPDCTVDCVLLFIPNEQLYAFVQEHDARILDDALRRKVVLCSPMTLFAVLAVIRQASETFRLARTSDEILSLLGGFRQQWGKFVDQMDKVGSQLDRAQRSFGDLVGTRRRMLERPLEQLDDLRARRELPAAQADDADAHLDSEGVLRLASGE